MKLRFYLDLCASTAIHQQGGLCAWTQPYGEKPDGFKRFAFDVELPESEILGVDAILPETNAIMVKRPTMITEKGEQ